MRPILQNSCAAAATAEEARFRIDRPIGSRAARVVALDDGAAEVVRRVALQPWGGARFFTCEGRKPAANGGASSGPDDLVLLAPDGLESPLSEELADADVAIMIATAGDGAAAASALARACAARGIMTAGLILGQRRQVGAAVAALRPHARVLMVTDDEGDVAEVLTALRA